MAQQRTALVLGGTGTIGHQLCNRLKEYDFWVRCVDRKMPVYSTSAADELIIADLRNEGVVSKAMFGPEQRTNDDKYNSFDMVFMLAAEMGGAGYVFTKENDSEILFNSAIMNLYVAKHATEKNVKKIFFSFYVVLF